MTAQDIINLALDNTHTKSSQYFRNGSYDSLVQAFNRSRLKVGVALLKHADNNNFFDIWTTDAIADQPNGEYPLPQSDSTHAGIYEIISVRIMPYWNSPEYLKSDEKKLQNLRYDWNHYLADQPKSLPIYHLADNSIFIAPQFSETDINNTADNGMIKFYGLRKFIDLTSAATEAEILVPDEYCDLIAKGMEIWMYLARGKRADSQISAEEFKNGIDDMLDGINTKINDEMIAQFPNQNERNMQFGE